MASLAVKCGDGVVRKSCCCNKSQAAKPPCDRPELRRAVCCELVELVTPGLTALDQLRAEPLAAPVGLGWGSATTDRSARLAGPFGSAWPSETGPPAGPPVYLRVCALLI